MLIFTFARWSPYDDDPTAATPFPLILKTFPSSVPTGIFIVSCP